MEYRTTALPTRDPIPDSKTYIHHILIPHLVPLYYALGGTGEGCMTIEDGASYHTSAETVENHRSSTDTTLTLTPSPLRTY